MNSASPTADVDANAAVIPAAARILSLSIYHWKPSDSMFLMAQA